MSDTSPERSDAREICKSISEATSFFHRTVLIFQSHIDRELRTVAPRVLVQLKHGKEYHKSSNERVRVMLFINRLRFDDLFHLREHCSAPRRAHKLILLPVFANLAEMNCKRAHRKKSREYLTQVGRRRPAPPLPLF